MGFYQGYNRFKTADGKLRIEYIIYDGQIKIETYDGPINIEEFCHPVIKIKSMLPLEEKVKVFIHEVFHLTSEYWKYLGQKLGPDHPVEKKIESDVQVIYDNQPGLVEHLKKKIQENLGKMS